MVKCSTTIRSLTNVYYQYYCNCVTMVTFQKKVRLFPQSFCDGQKYQIFLKVCTLRSLLKSEACDLFCLSGEDDINP